MDTRHDGSKINLSVSGVVLYQLPWVDSERGNLVVAEHADQLPFVVKRLFMVYGTQSEEIRGEHAHKTCEQYLICVAGSCAIIVDDGTHKQEIILNALNLGLYIPPMVWGIEYKYTPDAVLLVLASERYDPAEYIRDYDEYRRQNDFKITP